MAALTEVREYRSGSNERGALLVRIRRPDGKWGWGPQAQPAEAGQVLLSGDASDTSAGDPAYGFPATAFEKRMRTGAKAEIISRSQVNAATLSVPTGQIRFAACHVGRIVKGQTVNTITFMSGTTALVAGTSPHQWAILLDETRKVLAVTADRTNAAWAANAEQTFTIAGGYTATSTVYPILGLCVVSGAGGTQPTLQGQGSGAATSVILDPIVAGLYGSALTDPASGPAIGATLGSGVITGSGAFPWGYIS
jgi:hypothetical protein